MAMQAKTNAGIETVDKRISEAAMIAQTITVKGLATRDAVEQHESEDKCSEEHNQTAESTWFKNWFMRLHSFSPFPLHSLSVA